MGLGVGNAFMPMLTIAMADVPQHQAGLASGIVNVSQQVSGALGLAVLSTFATNHTNSLLGTHHPLDASLLSGYRLAYLIGIGAVVIGIGVAVALLRKHGREPASEVALDARRGDSPVVVRSGAKDQDLGGNVREQPSEVVPA
jgi:MFS family permease